MRYDSQLYAVRPKYAPEEASYRESLFSPGIQYGIIGMMIILS